MGPPPVVTGISPKEGPPGTRVIIRGEFLGIQPNDLIGLNIGGSDCLLSAEWKSPTKIIARSGPGKGRGDIIVTTRSGGRGTSTVQFRGYHETIGPLKESAVWVEEAPLQTLTWANRSLSHSSFHLEDPLGLSVEDNEKKFPEEELHELFPECSGDLASENFEPNWFLLEHHHATSFDDLKVGLSYLKRKVEHQKEGQLSFLKDNVSSVIEQLDTLFLLKDKFEEDFKIRGPDPTAKAEKAIRESMNESHKLFRDVLSRRELADAARNALNIVKRYKFLFYLPVNIERNIKQGDYELVISDYNRAKNLFGKVETRVFKNVLVEVEARVQSLKYLLKSKLKEMPMTLEQRKKIIRNLVTLGVESDPGWDAIRYAHNHVKEQLMECQETYAEMESACLEIEIEKSGKSSNYSSAQLPPSGSSSDANATPHRIKFVEDVSELLLELLSEFWKLGRSYFNAELQIKPDLTKQKEFKDKIKDVIELACNLLRSAVLPHTVNKEDHWPSQISSEISSIMDNVSAWLPHCVRCVSSMYISLLSLNFSQEAIEFAAKLIFDLRIHCLNTQLKRVAEQVKTFSKKETWLLDYDPEYGAITDLPNEFEKLVSNSLQRIMESTLRLEKKEIPVLESEELKKELDGIVGKIFMNFIQVLEVLGMVSEDSDHSFAVSQLIGSPAPYIEHESSEPIWEERLLAMLSNCRYTRIVLFPKLSQLFLSHGFSATVILAAQCDEALITLESRMIETYVELKCDPLVGTIEPSMYLGHFDWDTELKPTDMKPYAKEILTNITAICAEVYKLVPKLVYQIISQIVETVAEELSRLMSCVTRFSRYGNIQARIDITGLQRVLVKFVNDNARLFFKEALDVIPPLEDVDNKIVEDVLKSCFDKMKLQISCFSDPNTSIEQA